MIESKSMIRAIQIFIFTCLIFSFNLQLSAQSLERVEPEFWWQGMNSNQLQLLVYGPDMGSTTASINHKHVVLKNIHQADSPNYLFLDLVFTPGTEAFSFPIVFKKGGKKVARYTYEMKARRPGSAERKGFDNSDVMYLITPDRFVNGDPSNDEIAGLKEGINRAEEFGRHGGDLEGIRKNLDYIDDLGFTAIWLNPVLINDQPEWSYHGYAATDYYQVDPRFGSNEEYVQLSREAKEKGIGMIMDIIVNHCGSKHWWMEDQPFQDWINFQADPYVGTIHRKATLLDPYVARSDREQMVKGWFVPAMPDLNQRNKFMSTYLIQNSIWWIEYADLTGIRQDTYSYPFREFMTDWTCAILDEYPNFNIVGEEWVNDPAMVSYWQQGKVNQDGYTSCLPSVMDFPMNDALRKGLVEEKGWTEGLMRVYEMQAKDYHYADANALVIFPDNHDMSRIYTVVNEDYDLFKMAIAHTLTTRGVPQLYYGTEILMSHPVTDSHGAIRADYPGGWSGDEVNAFTGKGLTEKEKEARAFVRKLLQWRKTQKAVQEGSLVHYVPHDDVYVYFRSLEEQKIMVVFNKNKTPYSLQLDRFKDNMENVRTGKDVLTDETFTLQDSISLTPRSTLILELKN